MNNVVKIRKETNLDVLDDQIIQDQCIALGADTKTSSRKIDGKSKRFGPRCVGIGESNNLISCESVKSRAKSGCVHLVFEALDTGPCTQYKWIVGRDHGDDVDALPFELVIMLEVARQVLHVAGRLSGTVSQTPIE